MKGSMPKIRFITAFTGLIFVISVKFVFAGQTQWKGSITKEGDVTIVKNPKEPMFKRDILTLKEDFVLGGSQAQGESVFASAWSIAVDGMGNIYVGDRRQANVKVFDKAGVFIRTIGKRGQGPGELEGSIISVAIRADGRDLIVADMDKLVFFDLQGRFQKNIRLGSWAANACLDLRGNIFAWIIDIRGRRGILRQMSPDFSQVLAEIIAIPDPSDRNMFSPRPYWILDRQGRLIFGYPNAYEISFYNEHLKIAKMIRRTYEPSRVTDEDKKIYLKRSNPPGVSGPPKYPCPSVHAAFRSFFIDDREHLFVQTWERSADEKKDFYDIFDVDGRFIGRIALNAHPDFINPTPRILMDNKLYAIEEDKDGYEVVKRYSVEWLKK
jgi:hypothetical protein